MLWATEKSGSTKLEMGKTAECMPWAAQMEARRSEAAAFGSCQEERLCNC